MERTGQIDQTDSTARQAALRRRQISGLLLIAALILIVTLCRAGLHAIFPPGWWRFW